MNLKKRFLLAISSACVAGAASSEAATVASGDLIVGFRALSGQGAGTSYVVSIGQASLYRDADSTVTVSTTGGTYNRGDIGADLVSIYGANWSTRTDLVWAIVGTTGASDIYGSRAETTPGTVPAAWVFNTSGARSTVSGNITNVIGIGLPGGLDDATAMAGGIYGGREADGSANAWRGYLGAGGVAGQAGATGNTDFGAFPGDIEGNVTQSLSLFNITGNGSANSSYVGSFSISSNGTITMVPEPSSLFALLGGSALLISRRRRSA
ncbi:PEP-CTERM sorting domain-containing protein [Luteolibacter ambystomatis]|uniref:PEP-CTERM sorting domain-containing protein n=1 Tax=Luteolibacter ambystomatis TaxID=2824561 RepID=A0A975J050_9BACT|nr:PEP-CTERM sorting domain-containing protein [Luteolibacter ambystomatis]QUE51574.1 PEP-CTERM sorting domain-containing protein [Luteolibacter ambystomatis]